MCRAVIVRRWLSGGVAKDSLLKVRHPCAKASGRCFWPKDSVEPKPKDLGGLDAEVRRTASSRSDRAAGQPDLKRAKSLNPREIPFRADFPSIKTGPAMELR